MSEQAPDHGTGSSKLPAQIGIRAPLAVLLAVVFPGAGHFLLGQRGKAVLVAFVMVGAMWAGLDLGRWANFTPEAFDRHPVMFTLQFLSGAPAAAGYFLRSSAAQIDAFANPKLFEIALLYTCVIGLLNLLLIIDVIALPGRQLAKAKAARETTRKAELAAKAAAPETSPVPALETPVEKPHEMPGETPKPPASASSDSTDSTDSAAAKGH